MPTPHSSTGAGTALRRAGNGCGIRHASCSWPTWAVDFDAAWHRAALGELLRVAAQVRVFPLVHQATGAPVEFLPQLVEQLRRDGVQTQVRRVPYVFQRGADTMLVLTAARR